MSARIPGTSGWTSQSIDVRRDGSMGLNSKERAGGAPAFFQSALGLHLSKSAAMALTRLREYFGSPALIEFPVLNELFPASTCAGTRLRRIGTLSSSFFFSKRSLSTASAMNVVATDFLASVGSGCSTAR